MTTHLVSHSAARVGDPDRAGRLILGRNALRHGHFRLICDLHTDIFLAFSKIADDLAALDLVAQWLAPSVAAWRPAALLAPSTAGVGLASSIARLLEIPLQLAQLDQTGRACGIIGAADLAGGRVSLVNDVVTTGRGLGNLKDVAESSGASVVGAAWFARRQPVDVNDALSIPTAHVLDLDLPAWSADGCKLCSSDVLVEDALDLN